MSTGFILPKISGNRQSLKHLDPFTDQATFRYFHPQSRRANSQRIQIVANWQQ